MKKDFMEGVHDLYIQLQGTLPRYDLSPLGNEAGGQGTSAVIDEGEMAAGAAVLGAAGAAVLTEVNDSNTTEASNNLSPDDINPHNAPVQGDADSQQRHQQSCIGNKAPHIQPEGHKFNPALDPLPHAQDRGQGIPIPSSPFPTRRQSL